MITRPYLILKVGPNMIQHYPAVRVLLALHKHNTVLAL